MDEEALIRRLRQEVGSSIDYSQSLSDELLTKRIEEAVFALSRELPLHFRKKNQLIRRVFSSFRGLDILQPLLDDPAVTEIMVNSHTEIFYEQAGKIRSFQGGFDEPARLEDMIQAIVSKVNRTVNESQPIVDARLADGSRVHVVLPPVALKGPTLTIRKFPSHPLTMEELVNRESISAEAAAFLKQAVQAKYNIFISGGTGSGKTTFLNALSGWIPQGERVITIEDSAELQIRQVDNLVSLETRNANTEGKGQITMRDLIRASLRMRPNRIIVGEVRGGEALEMLQAMNTGHDGSLSTGHSNSSKDMLSRLETMVLMGAALPVQVIRSQIASALDLLVHLSRMRDGSRRVVEIAEVTGIREGDIEIAPLFLFQEAPSSNPGSGRVKGALCATGHMLANRQKLRDAGLEDVPDRRDEA
ncbi:CpaF family protein [Paenibacillus sp. YN15]|uniref:CpaF family protein n=1 Tax=Paenibacillus sp. YN15 TaxID=1742774 RepID=UPI000DCB1B4A|nr:CpaF family protein [Paenibacillus sp. YN15]RAV02410.1 CpaF family protein [Paenibacillus sp. YN15]